MSVPIKHEADLCDAVLNVLPHPILVVGKDNAIIHANYTAQMFFQAGASWFTRHTLDEIMPYGSPVLSLLPQARARSSLIKEYRIDVSTPRTGGSRIVDVFATPLDSTGEMIAIMFHERSITDKFDRQLTHRSAAKSVTGLAAMLAHEIKNPLSGIRGAAQLLEQSACKEDRALTRLITDEADRIAGLVDRMEVFSDHRPIKRQPLNIHTVFDHVIRLASSGFAANLRIIKLYDPSLPLVFANRDQLIQVFLNLIKNAQEACNQKSDGEITITSAYRPGVRIATAGSAERIALPMEFCVIDNGSGISDEIMPHLFDPFISSKTNGKGLGLALVAKIIGDHGGIIDCKSEPRQTVFRILLPAYVPPKMKATDKVGETGN